MALRRWRHPDRKWAWQISLVVTLLFNFHQTRLVCQLDVVAVIGVGIVVGIAVLVYPHDSIAVSVSTIRCFRIPRVAFVIRVSRVGIDWWLHAKASLAYHPYRWCLAMGEACAYVSVRVVGVGDSGKDAIKFSSDSFVETITKSGELSNCGRTFSSFPIEKVFSSNLLFNSL